jgi:hypothetical protein
VYDFEFKIIMPECQHCTKYSEPDEMAPKPLTIAWRKGLKEGCIEELKVCTLCFVEAPPELRLRKGTLIDSNNGVWLESKEYHKQSIKGKKRQLKEAQARLKDAEKAYAKFKIREYEKSASNSDAEEEEETKSPKKEEKKVFAIFDKKRKATDEESESPAKKKRKKSKNNSYIADEASGGDSDESDDEDYEEDEEEELESE